MKYFYYILLLTLMISCDNIEKTEQKILKEEIKTPNITFVRQVPITGAYDLAFAKIDTCCNQYKEPYLKVGEKVYPIKGFPPMNSSSDRIIALSPDGRYFIMDSISNNDKADKNSCVVVDLLHKRVVRQLQSHCDGEWNSQGQWVKDGQIILSLD